ncbi:MAG: hypothetical protein KDE47_33165 [Caldilineaceae bacterium]|nr:hypothetical protein [Caldilineaceae bacterium]MCB0096445.1 hypothetical protein [Caldilineaceae bacterium]
MKSTLFNLSLTAGRINSRHVKAALAIVSLTLFALGASAPGAYTGF